MQAGREVDIPVYDFVAHSRYEALVQQRCRSRIAWFSSRSTHLSCSVVKSKLVLKLLAVFGLAFSRFLY